MINKISEELKIGLVAAVCILTLAIVLKNVLQVKAGIAFMGPLWVYIAYLTTRGGKQSKCDKPLCWNLAIVFVTVATIILYAFF